MSTTILRDDEIQKDIQEAIKTMAVVAILYKTKKFTSKIELSDNDGNVRRFEITVKEVK